LKLGRVAATRSESHSRRLEWKWNIARHALAPLALKLAIKTTLLIRRWCDGSVFTNIPNELLFLIWEFAT
jgi:hypothetical protein